MSQKKAPKISSQNELVAENKRLKARVLELEGGAPISVSTSNDNELLAQVLEASSCAYLEWTVAREDIYYSDHVWLMLGYKPGEFTNTPKTAFSLLYPGDRDRVYQLFTESVQSGEGYSTEARVVDIEGKARWIRIQTKVFDWDAGGRATRMVGLISNIDALTELQIKAEKQSERASWINRISSRLFEKGDLTSIRWGLGEIAKMVSGNRAYLRLINPVNNLYELVAEWHSPELQPSVKLLDEDDELLMQKAISKLLDVDGIHMSLTSAIRAPEIRAVRDKLDAQAQCGIPLFSGDSLQGVLVITSAVDEMWAEDDVDFVGEFARLVSLVFYRHKMADDLALSQQRFHDAMDATNDGVWDVNLIDGSIFVNAAYFGMLGYDKSEELKNWNEVYALIHPDDRAKMRSYLKSFMKSDGREFALEYRMLHKNGNAVSILARGKKMLYDEAGVPSRLIGVNTDVTDFRLALTKLDEARVEARAASLAKSEFLARMSHEIRTPMNAILGMSHFALATELDSSQRDYLTHIDGAAKSLLSIIDDILDFSKIEAGKLEIESLDFDFSVFVSRLANIMAIRAEQKNVELFINIDPKIPFALRGDETRLSQVFINLMSNAVKFTEEGCVVVSFSVDTARESEARSKEVGATLVVKVKDTGIGIARDKLQALFDPFSQGDGSVTRKFGGTGLGLTICKHLVEMMQGKVSVESEVGGGSEFTVTLPLIRQSSSKTQSNRDLRLLDKCSDVILLSDNGHQQMVINNIVERYGGSLRVFPDAKTYLKCLDKVSNEPLAHDLLLIDSRSVCVSDFSQCKYAARNFNERIKVGLLVSIHDTEYSDAVGDEDWVRTLSYPFIPEKFVQFVGPNQCAEIRVPDIDQALGRLHGMKVLLAEDNLVNQKVAQGLLKKKGVEVAIANNGVEALLLLRAQPVDHFDVVLMDMEMPEMDGYQATREIRNDNDHSGMTIIAMTAHAMKGDREKCLNAGMDEYLTKPIKPMALYHMLLAFR